MSKKNKKKNIIDDFMFVNYGHYGPEQPKEGALRFHQKIVEKRFTDWLGFRDYKEIGSSEKVLQQFNGKDWGNIPFERDYIEI